MDKLCLFLILGLIASQSTCMNIREKRQTNDGADKLEDRYGWNGPTNGVKPTRDRFPMVFPGQNPFDINTDYDIFNFLAQGQISGQGQIPNQRPLPNEQIPSSSTTAAPSNSGPTTLSPSVQQCIKTCPTTPEYNPVCGSDSQTYTNPGRLTCAQACGVNVNLSRQSPCPATTQAPN